MHAHNTWRVTFRITQEMYAEASFRESNQETKP
jgi:hypothetical protein